MSNSRENANSKRVGNLLIAAGFDESSGRWLGVSYIMHGEDIHCMSLSSEPVFKSAEEAINAIEQGEKVKAERISAAIDFWSLAATGPKRE